MATTGIPCVLMRGGTSRGPFFLASDLPADPAARDAILLSVMGSGHELEIDGLGGGNPLTSKVAIVGASTIPGADVDYLFAQVKVLERVVDVSPNCGNMLAGVGPFAIEAGLVAAQTPTTTLRIHNVNTGKIIEARVQTPGGRVTYDGDVAISGVPGAGAPIYLTFLNAAGAKTGRLLPTSAAVDRIEGVEASCVDAATPLVILRAADLGKTGWESPQELDADIGFLRRLESIRREAGRRMGLGDVSRLVIPKPVLIAPPRAGGALSVRYFMPQACHKALAVTGAVGVATAAATPGTLVARLVGAEALPRDITIEHPSGAIDVRIEQRPGQGEPSASLVRTARRIFEGVVFARLPADMPAAVAA